jgi:phosphoglycerate dehydrogenase-like enzyme
MKTYGVNSTGRNVANFQRITTLSNVDEILPLSDVVVVALPLTVKTRGLIDRDKLNKMKEDCILINVARAAIVVERDLFEHLTNHPKFRAAFDVWWRKWPKSAKEKYTQNYPFFQLPNFIGTPHISGDVPESHEIASMFAVENIIRYVENRELKGLVDRRDYLGL